MINTVIVRIPAKTIINGISSKNEKPDYKKALIQHENYIQALKKCNVSLISILNPLEKYPDSCFVEDTAVLTDECAIITNIGTESRKGEEKFIIKELENFYTNIFLINSPGTLDGGDVLQIEQDFYIGISERTNKEGAIQLKNILENFNYNVNFVNIKNLLHLKTGISYLGNNYILASTTFKNYTQFEKYNIIFVDDDEIYSANSININDFIIMPDGYPKTLKKIKARGFKVLKVSTSEFKKIDGGLSCLSLRI